MRDQNTYIMVIEDNEDDFEAVENGFKSVGLKCKIKWSPNAVEALAHFNPAFDLTNLSELIPPKIILLDLNMPGIDGRKMLHLIKANPILASVPVVAFTSSIDQKDIAYCYANGVNSYIQKPSTFDKLQEVCATLKAFWFDTSIV